MALCNGSPVYCQYFLILQRIRLTGEAGSANCRFYFEGMSVAFFTPASSLK